MAYGPTTLGAVTQVVVLLPRRGVTRLVISSSVGSSKRYVIPWFFSLAVEPRLFGFRFFRVFYFREPFLGFAIAKPLGFVNLPIRLGPSPGYSGAMLTVA